MKPFLHGKKTSSNAPLTARSAEPAATGIAPLVRPRAGGAMPNATIDVVKEGDKVVRLVVTCSCGERMEVECIYPAGV